MAAVQLEDVAKSYDGRTWAIHGLDLRCEVGEMLALLGPSGCGKSTTLKMIAGIERASAGRILFNGRDVSDLDTAQRNVAMVFEDYALYPHLTVFENIAFPLRVRGRLRSEVEREVGRVLDLLDLQGLRDAGVRQLSGGAQQRVSIGRALVREPDLVMFDEPLSHMDADQKVLLRSEIARLQKAARLTSVLVTHDQTEAVAMADRIAVMNHGVLQQVATPGEIYARPANLFVASFIGEPPMNLVPATVSVDLAGRTVLALNGRHALTLPDGPAAAWLRQRPGGEVVVGLRPEHLRPGAGDGDGNGDDGPAPVRLDGTVRRCETCGDHDVLTLDTPAGGLVAEVDGPSHLREGQPLPMTIAPHRLHLFDPASTRNLLDLLP